MNRTSKYDSAVFTALKNSPIPQAILSSPGTRFDGVEDASVFFARELDHVMANSYDVEYPELTALAVFPQTSEADPGAETVTYYTYDKTGLAKVIDNYSTDLPRADVNGKPTYAQIKSIGASYGYSVQEMRASRLAGKSLDSRKAESARFAIDSAINRIAWAGDADNGLMGVLSEGQNIPLFTILAGATTGETKWTKKNADEILYDINGMAKQVAKVTKNVERPDTLCVPAEVFMDIATRRIPDTATTVKDFLLEHSPYIKDIVSTAELDSDSVDTNPYAASEGVGVAFLFKNDKMKLALENPMPYMQHPLQVQNLETTVPCEARTAGVIVYYPLSALIAVGVC